MRRAAGAIFKSLALAACVAFPWMAHLALSGGLAGPWRLLLLVVPLAALALWVVLRPRGRGGPQPLAQMISHAQRLRDVHDHFFALRGELGRLADDRGIHVHHLRATALEHPADHPEELEARRVLPLRVARREVRAEVAERALHGAHYDKLEDGTFCAEVPELRGVIATGDTLEECRDQLAEVIEEWVLVRVSQGLEVPPLDDIEIKVQKAG